MDAIKHYRQQSLLGDSLRNLVETREWVIFKTEVLDVIHNAAFDLFLKSDPTVSGKIIEAQQKAIIVRDIESRVNQLIEQGRLAIEQMSRLSEGEENE
jgi:hypothetical protein